MSGNQPSSVKRDTVFFIKMISRYAYEFDMEDLIACTEKYRHSDDALIYIEEYLRTWKTETVSKTYLQDDVQDFESENEDSKAKKKENSSKNQCIIS